jgi:pimeloyl-ACP methyl ester carboxylesterase
MEVEVTKDEATVVMAHGAWADGSSWSKVIKALYLDSIKAVTAPLPLTSLADDVAALAPAEGQTVADVFYMNEPHPKAPRLKPDNHGLIWLPSAAFAAAFAQNASSEEQAVLDAVQRPISSACITVPVGRPLWMDVPTWYLLAEQDHMIVPRTQRFMAERMKARISAHPVDHTPSVTAPGAGIANRRRAPDQGLSRGRGEPLQRGETR